MVAMLQLLRLAYCLAVNAKNRSTVMHLATHSWPSLVKNSCYGDIILGSSEALLKCSDLHALKTWPAPIEAI